MKKKKRPDSLRRPRGRPRKTEGAVAPSRRVQIRLNRRQAEFVRADAVANNRSQAATIEAALLIAEQICEAIVAGKLVIFEDPKGEQLRERYRPF